MEENHPARFMIHADSNRDVSPTQAAIQLGETRGYSAYGNGLLILGKPVEQYRSPGEPTYEKPAVEEQYG